MILMALSPREAQLMASVARKLATVAGGMTRHDDSVGDLADAAHTTSACAGVWTAPPPAVGDDALPCAVAPMQWALACDIPATQKVVLLALASHVTDDEASTGPVCTLSARSLADMTNLTVRSVFGALRKLEDGHYIARSPQPSGHDTLYRLLTDQHLANQLRTNPHCMGAHGDQAHEGAAFTTQSRPGWAGESSASPPQQPPPAAPPPIRPCRQPPAPQPRPAPAPFAQARCGRLCRVAEAPSDGVAYDNGMPCSRSLGTAAVSRAETVHKMAMEIDWEIWRDTPLEPGYVPPAVPPATPASPGAGRAYSFSVEVVDGSNDSREIGNTERSSPAEGNTLSPANGHSGASATDLPRLYAGHGQERRPDNRHHSSGHAPLNLKITNRDYLASETPCGEPTVPSFATRTGISSATREQPSTALASAARHPMRPADRLPTQSDRSARRVDGVLCNAIDEGFERFWDAYPRKEKKIDAIQVWRTIQPNDALIADIMAGLDLARRSHQWGREAGRFIPHPGNWLRDRRWQDVPGVDFTTAQKGMGVPAGRPNVRMENTVRNLAMVLGTDDEQDHLQRGNLLFDCGVQG
jgi:hypothetical protein